MDGDRKEHMDFAVEGAFRMNSLINDLLDYASLQPGAISPALLNLDTIAADAIAGLKQKIDAAGAEVIAAKTAAGHRR